jgi:NADH-quinone oxidoreductase subunit G
MATIFIDNKAYEVKDGQNLLQACLSLGLNLPYFCWHPELGSVGACRQCAVKQFKDEHDTRGRLVMACMTPVAGGTRISIDESEAREFRASITEWLMVNHPHDCPVCDEGGECHLQDMTLMTGHTYRRFRGDKRTFRNQDLGPFVNHEMNRCIQCYRCVRFYRDYAGGRDLDAFALRNHVYFGRYEDGVLESEFSGNLVEVCPTGVFTDKTLKRHYTRKWDLQTAPSVCVHCSLGCNTIPGERYGQLRRIRNRYNGAVNRYFLCDRGRYGYEFVNGEDRLRRPSMRKGRGEKLGAVSKADVLREIGNRLRSATGIIGIGSPRASLEANFALCALVGPERFYAGVSERELRLISGVIKVLRTGPARSPSLHDVQLADAVLILGEDVTNAAPMLALSLRQSVRREAVKIADKLHIPEWNDAAVRQAAQEKKGPLFVAAPCATRLDDIATAVYRAAPDELARLGFAVAHALHSEAPGVAPLTDTARSVAERIAQALKGAERPLVVSGTTCGSEAIVHAAANVSWALCANGRPTELCFIAPECNSFGVGLIGGNSIDAAFQVMRDGLADTVVIVENDLYRRADAVSVDAFLGAAKHVIALDHLSNATTLKADAVLPVATFAEGDGTFVNNEGRAQRFYQVFVSGDDTQESWRWLRDVMIAAGRAEADLWKTLDDVTCALAQTMPVFQAITTMPATNGFLAPGQKIPRQPHRYSGRTAMLADITVHEPKPPDDPDAPLSYSMEGYPGEPPPALTPRFWAPGWNSIQALNKFQSEIGGPLRGGDPGRRLIEPAQVEKISYFPEVPVVFQPREQEWLIVALYHIFGSEELSVMSRGIAGLAPQPYLGLNPADASHLHVKDGEQIQLLLHGVTRRLPVKSMPSFPRGVAGLPIGLPGLAGIILPAWGELVAAEKAGQPRRIVTGPHLFSPPRAGED